MADPAGTSIFATIGRWFGKEPAVAVAAFGKCSTANGHQDVAGDSTRGMLETARRLYYEGALPNGRTWESELRAADPVLARTVVRWTADRAFVCRLIPVAEGGSDATGFAPLVVCVEVESASALAVLPSAVTALREVESSLAGTGPAGWPGILRPVREAIHAEVERFRGGSFPSQAARAGEAVRSVIERLGPDSGRWFASLAEELGLPLRSEPDPSRRESAGGSRAASAPRLGDASSGVPVEGDVAAWTGCLVAAGLGGRGFWILAADEMQSLRLIAGGGREQEFHALWRSREAAREIPAALGDRILAAQRPRVDAWLSSLGLGVAWPEAASVSTAETPSPPGDSGRTLAAGLGAESAEAASEGASS